MTDEETVVGLFGGGEEGEREFFGCFEGFLEGGSGAEWGEEVGREAGFEIIELRGGSGGGRVGGEGLRREERGGRRESLALLRLESSKGSIYNKSAYLWEHVIVRVERERSRGGDGAATQREGGGRRE